MGLLISSFSEMLREQTARQFLEARKEKIEELIYCESGPLVLGDLVNFKFGQPLDGEMEESGRFQVYGAGGPIGWTDKALSKGKTIIIGRVGSIKIHYSEKAVWVTNNAMFVGEDDIKHPNLLDHKYLYYALLSLEPQLKQIFGQGSVLKTITKKQLESIPVLPR